MALKMEQLMAIGVFLIIVGFLIVFFGIFKSAKESSPTTKVAIGGFIGFIPFGFGNDKNLLWLVSIVSLVLLLFWLFFQFKLIK